LLLQITQKNTNFRRTTLKVFQVARDNSTTNSIVTYPFPLGNIDLASRDSCWARNLFLFFFYFILIFFLALKVDIPDEFLFSRLADTRLNKLMSRTVGLSVHVRECSALVAGPSCVPKIEHLGAWAAPRDIPVYRRLAMTARRHRTDNVPRMTSFVFLFLRLLPDSSISFPFLLCVHSFTF
jgi:hypothetical protein